MNSLQYDVVIAGCGPTGATFANYFGKLGLKTLIFDIESNIIEFPRAVHIDEDTIRIFQELGLYEAMKQTAIKPFSNYSLVTKEDKTLFQFQPNSSVSESIPDCNWILQPELEKYIREGFQQYDNVTFLSKTKWLDIKSNKDFVTIRLNNDELKTFVINSKYLIACDGGKSPIRKKLNIKVKDLGFKKDWFVIDSYYQGNETFSEDHKQFCDPKQPITYVNGVRNHFRWEFMITNKTKNLSEEQLELKMLPKLKKFFPIEDFEIIRKKKYTFHTVIAEKWREGNIFLAGDAAHQMPPFLGQGMCSGLKDAKNLAWKMAIACKNQNYETDKLLDSYHSERYKQVNKILHVAATLGGFIQFSNPLLSPIRNTFLKFLNILPSKPIDKLIDNHLYALNITKKREWKHSLIGKRMIQPKIIHKNESIYLDELLGIKWNIILRDNISFYTKNTSSFYNLFTVNNNSDTNFNIQSSTIEDWMLKNKLDFVVIRPDKFIEFAGTKNQLTDIIAYINKYLSQIYQN
ncbi:MAG: FAD-dependent monooxygenase [Limnohabitans sp.]|nr:FAD-dependent monooxygenase [Limnohabitans sp.]